MKTKELIFTLLYNICVLVICATLAVVFNHWWIIFFSVLFMCFPKFILRHYRICDSCGRRSEYAETREEALKLAEKAGWKHYDTGNIDYCPECWHKINNL